MMRKLVILTISGAICLFGITPLLAQTNWGWSTLQEYERVTGEKIEKFNEAPMLRVKVAAGELPPVEKRLPEEPLVDKPFEEVGKYGGTLRLAMVSPATWYPATIHIIEQVLNMDREAKEIVPDIAKDWEFSDEGKTLTLYLRKGMKWSDGAPFTADDILFFWEGVVLNDEIMPVKPRSWMPGGKLMTVEKVDDYTVRLRFSVPYWGIIWKLGVYEGWQNAFYLPKHALKKYHIKYNPGADKLAKEEGYDKWWQLFNAKRMHGFVQQALDIPSLTPWVVKQVLPEGVVYERNPYYFKIDTAGNQLPYIDTIKATPFTDTETMVLKMLSGEYDYQDWGTALKDYPVLMEGAKKGGYKVWLAPSFWGGDVCTYRVNQNYNEDPVIGDILRDVRFRRALSLAINREEFNELFFMGKAVPRQATVHPSCSFYKEEWAKAYAEYDPERANELLDDMGLDKRDPNGYRLRPDGKPLHLIISHVPDAVPIVYSEVVREYWEEIGIKTSIKPVDRQYMGECFNNGKFMIAPWALDGTAENAIIAGGFGYLMGWSWAPQWMAWWSTKGEKGEEPPEEVKRMMSLNEKVPYLPKKERNKALQEALDIWAKNIWAIGIVGMAPKPAITNINLGNVDTDTYTDNTSVCGGYFNRMYQFFWKK